MLCASCRSNLQSFRYDIFNGSIITVFCPQSRLMEWSGMMWSFSSSLRSGLRMSSTSRWESLVTLSLCDRGQHPPNHHQTLHCTCLTERLQRIRGNANGPPAVIVFLWKSYWLTTMCSIHNFHVVNLMFLTLMLLGVVVVFYTLQKEQVLFCKICATASEVFWGFWQFATFR